MHFPLPSFILAVDYFHTIFPGSTIIFDISLIYILTSLLAVLLNNLIMHMVSLTTRILSGYVISLVVSLLLLLTSPPSFSSFSPWKLYRVITNITALNPRCFSSSSPP